MTFSAGNASGNGGGFTFAAGAAPGGSIPTAGNSTSPNNGGGFMFNLGTSSGEANGDYEIVGMKTGSGTTLVLDANNNMLKSSSSRRYKNDVTQLQVDRSAVLELVRVRFRWNSTGAAAIGLIAEDVETAVKDLVIYDNEGSPDGVKHDRLALYLLELVRQREINDLKATVQSSASR